MPGIRGDDDEQPARRRAEDLFVLVIGLVGGELLYAGGLWAYRVVLWTGR